MPVVKLITGGMSYPVAIEEHGDKWQLQFKYAPPLINEVRCMEGARWDSEKKIWKVERSRRNAWTLRYLLGKDNPYARYDTPLPEYTPIRTEKDRCYDRPGRPFTGVQLHQRIAVAQFLTRRRATYAAEPGMGKTLAVIEALETLQRSYDRPLRVCYSGTKTAVEGVKEEFRFWRCTVPVTWWTTYDGVKRLVNTWEPGQPAPDVWIPDEGQKLKGHKSQRSEAGLHLSHSMLDDHGDDSYIWELTGTPAPEDPTDWWMQCEIVCPGFLRESSYYRYRDRVFIMEERSGLHGNYPHEVQVKDGGECVTCKESLRLVAELETESVGMKKDLPAYAEADVHRIGEILKALDQLELKLRTCKYCSGTRRVPNEVDTCAKAREGLVLVHMKRDWQKHLPPNHYRELIAKSSDSVLRAAYNVASSATNALDALNKLRQLSDGFLYDENGVAQRGETPKDELFQGLLEQYEDSGRGIAYAGYTASIDHVVELCLEQGWSVWRNDGRGHWCSEGWDFQTSYAMFQRRITCPKKKLMYVAHPGSGGVSITLTASLFAAYYSNDFSGEARSQSKERGNREGMDLNNGFTIWDFFNLATDRLVRDKLDNKERLEDMSLGVVLETLRRII